MKNIKYFKLVKLDYSKFNNIFLKKLRYFLQVHEIFPFKKWM